MLTKLELYQSQFDTSRTTIRRIQRTRIELKIMQSAPKISNAMTQDQSINAICLEFFLWEK